MDELTRLQLLTEAVMEFRTQLRNDFEVDNFGQMVVEIVRKSNDSHLIELVEEAYKQRNNSKAAIDILTEAMSYMHDKIDQQQRNM